MDTDAGDFEDSFCDYIVFQSNQDDLQNASDHCKFEIEHDEQITGPELSEPTIKPGASERQDSAFPLDHVAPSTSPGVVSKGSDGVSSTEPKRPITFGESVHIGIGDITVVQVLQMFPTIDVFIDRHVAVKNGLVNRLHPNLKVHVNDRVFDILRSKSVSCTDSTGEFAILIAKKLNSWYQQLGLRTFGTSEFVSKYLAAFPNESESFVALVHMQQQQQRQQEQQQRHQVDILNFNPSAFIRMGVNSPSSKSSSSSAGSSFTERDVNRPILRQMCPTVNSFLEKRGDIIRHLRRTKLSPQEQFDFAVCVATDEQVRQARARGAEVKAKLNMWLTEIGRVGFGDKAMQALQVCNEKRRGSDSADTDSENDCEDRRNSKNNRGNRNKATSSMAKDGEDQIDVKHSNQLAKQLSQERRMMEMTRQQYEKSHQTIKRICAAQIKQAQEEKMALSSQIQQEHGMMSRCLEEWNEERRALESQLSHVQLLLHRTHNELARERVAMQQLWMCQEQMFALAQESVKHCHAVAVTFSSASSSPSFNSSSSSPSSSSRSEATADGVTSDQVTEEEPTATTTDGENVKLQMCRKIVQLRAQVMECKEKLDIIAGLRDHNSSHGGGGTHHEGPYLNMPPRVYRQQKEYQQLLQLQQEKEEQEQMMVSLDQLMAAIPTLSSKAATSQTKRPRTVTPPLKPSSDKSRSAQMQMKQSVGAEESGQGQHHLQLPILPPLITQSQPQNPAFPTLDIDEMNNVASSSQATNAATAAVDISGPDTSFDAVEPVVVDVPVVSRGKETVQGSVEPECCKKRKSDCLSDDDSISINQATCSSSPRSSCDSSSNVEFVSDMQAMLM